MSAFIKACKTSDLLKNTGIDSQISLGPAAMFFLCPKNFAFTDADLEDFTTFMQGKINAPAASRVYPIFGNAAPIRGITNNKENDVISVQDDGAQVFVRYGFYNRMFNTTDGGLCYAKSLQSFKESGYGILEVDKEGKFVARKVSAGNYKALPVDFMYSPSPDMATLKDPFKSNFMISYSPSTFVAQGIVFAEVEGAGALLDLSGLIDLETSEFASAEVVTGSTAAVGHLTVSAIGADGDSINVKVNGVTISGVVVKTAAETTATLFAAKVAAYITAASTLNGGYTATNTGAVLNFTGPTSLGASLNTVLPTSVVTGTAATSTAVAFTGGVTTSSKIKLDVGTECCDENIVEAYPTEIAHLNNFVVKNEDGDVVTPTAIAVVAEHVEITGPFISGETYTVTGGLASDLYTNGLIGYEISNSLDVTIP